MRRCNSFNDDPLGIGDQTERIICIIGKASLIVCLKTGTYCVKFTVEDTRVKLILVRNTKFCTVRRGKGINISGVPNVAKQVSYGKSIISYSILKRLLITCDVIHSTCVFLFRHIYYFL